MENRSMRKRLIRSLIILIAAAGLSLSGPGVQRASACPMCKAAAEQDDRQPMAYMYSILFMLSVPGTMGIGMVVGLVVLGRKEAQAMQDAGLGGTQETSL
jgi:hypothetical protein